MADPAAPVRPSASEPPVLGVWSSPAIEDVLFPELKDFFKTSITGLADACWRPIQSAFTDTDVICTDRDVICVYDQP
jgi:hypothetical protein